MRASHLLLIGALLAPEVALALPFTPIEQLDATVLSARKRRKKKKKKAATPPPSTSTGSSFEGLDLTGETAPAQTGTTEAEGEGEATEGSMTGDDLLNALDEEGEGEPEDAAEDAGEVPAAPPPAPPSKRQGLHAFVGGDGAVAPGLPTRATGLGLGYFAGARYALGDKLELDLSIGQQQLGTFGTITLSWPSWRWLGQFGIEAAGRYMVAQVGAMPLYAGLSVKSAIFTASAAQRGFYDGAWPVMPGLEVGTRFKLANYPLDLALRGHLWKLTGGFVPVLGLTTRLEVF